MTSRDFCYWLQGYFELATDPDLKIHQIVTVKQHLAMVFKHEIDPAMGAAAHQSELNSLHKPTLGGVDPVSGLVIRC